jgi:maltose O-acetyltransferase
MTMSAVGVPPLTSEQLRRRHGAAIGELPDDARSALHWLRRGYLVTSPLLPLALRRTLLRLGGVRLGTMVSGLERCRFQSPRVSIGTGSYVNAGCWFEGSGEIVIGDNCLLGPEVLLLTSTHRLDPDGSIDRLPEFHSVTIGDGAWIGARATIMPGVKVGAGAVIAAGATVTKDCDPGVVYGGVPAKRIR